jgi:hypothetical protein
MTVPLTVFQVDLRAVMRSLNGVERVMKVCGQNSSRLIFIQEISSFKDIISKEITSSILKETVTISKEITPSILKETVIL